MSSGSAKYLYDLLPAVYRMRDAEQGEPLRALLDVIGPEMDRVQDDIAGLYDNWFIETCDEWVVPYIGDLLGVRPIRSVPTAGVSTRAYVANTLAYRRRKGTAFVLEQLARDTTGWPAHAVEFFQLLATAQNVNHVRHKPHVTPSVRNAARAELAGTAFDEFAHLPEMRRIATRGGRYNVPNVGIYLWRLQSYPLSGVTARRLTSGEPNTFAFHPVGVDMQLFNAASSETEMTHLAEEQNVPAPLRRLTLNAEFAGLRHGSDAALRFMSREAPSLRLFVEIAGAGTLTEIEPRNMYICDIPDDVELASPPPLVVAIDSARGRMRFPAALDVTRVLTNHHYGFPGDLGGGSYDRAASLAQGQALPARRYDWQVGVSHAGETAFPPAQIFSSVAAAVAEWNNQPPGLSGVIAILDNETDGVFAASPAAVIEIEIKAGSRLLIVAASWPRREDFTRPVGSFVPAGLRAHIRSEIVVRGLAPTGAATAGELVLNGLLIEGALTVADGSLGALSLQHCTLASPHSLEPLQVSQGNDRLELNIDRSVVGGVVAGVPLQSLEVRDSIISATAGSPSLAVDAATTACVFESSTFEGAVSAQTLIASNCLFNAMVSAVRRQSGCVRFSYVPPGSATPRRYRCQPELAIQQELGDTPHAPAEIQAIRDSVSARIRPLFVSLHYGDAQYGQLELRCPVELRTGADDGSEMGAYRFLQQAHRESNLRTVLQEYLRFGLEAGVFFVT